MSNFNQSQPKPTYWSCSPTDYIKQNTGYKTLRKNTNIFKHSHVIRIHTLHYCCIHTLPLWWYSVYNSIPRFSPYGKYILTILPGIKQIQSEINESVSCGSSEALAYTRNTFVRLDISTISTFVDNTSYHMGHFKHTPALTLTSIRTLTSLSNRKHEVAALIRYSDNPGGQHITFSLSNSVRFENSSTWPRTCVGFIGRVSAYAVFCSRKPNCLLKWPLCLCSILIISTMFRWFFF